MKQILKDFIRKLRSILLSIFNKDNPNLSYIITAIIAFIVVVGGMNIFIELTEHLKKDLLADYDKQIADYIISFRTPVLTKYFTFITHIGDRNGYLIALALFTLITYLAFKKWKYVIQITSVLLISSASNIMLKRFIDRARPDIEHLVSVTTLSYPSGHAMSAMAFYGFLIYLVSTFKMNIFFKTSLIVVFILIILSIGISRIYLGVHFPTDIAGGYVAGLFWVFFCILIINLVHIYRKRK
ncbi:phosphatase PAP2 family protein [Bernardetia sp.]|uniref:phosphatase PAP2 family protein n=1 Tax=Bernardetia sp. TaxID=1937974 RepID=UPI0025BD8257|nr:phosphatase PAP2 family protein [Bernardetia sp.]